MNPSSANINRIVRPLVESVTADPHDLVMAEWHQWADAAKQAALHIAIDVAQDNYRTATALRRENADLRLRLMDYQFWTKMAGCIVFAVLVAVTYFLLVKEPVRFDGAGLNFAGSDGGYAGVGVDVDTQAGRLLDTTARSMARVAQPRSRMPLSEVGTLGGSGRSRHPKQLGQLQIQPIRVRTGTPVTNFQMRAA